MGNLDAQTCADSTIEVDLGSVNENGPLSISKWTAQANYGSKKTGIENYIKAYQHV